MNATRLLDRNSIDDANRWRLETPGQDGWKKSARPGAPNKYLMISCDTHALEPMAEIAERIDPKYRDRLPRVWTDETGQKWFSFDGGDPVKYQLFSHLEGDDAIRGAPATAVAERLADQRLDGVDAEIIFPQNLSVFHTRDPGLAFAQARAFSDWSWEHYGAHADRLAPMAPIPAMDVDMAVAEVERVAKLGFRGFTLPVKPMFGSQDPKDLAYNQPAFDRLWSAIQATGLPATFHVGTARDPRLTRGRGGAVTNYLAHALAPSVEVVTILVASGVLERCPGLKVAAIECGIGWLPWAGATMDEAYRKHHMWTYPKLKELPSHYLKSQCFCSFQEDEVGLALVERFGYVNSVLWANDYPHMEGSWPHSAEAIERQMGHLKEESRERILGLNARGLFNL